MSRPSVILCCLGVITDIGSLLLSICAANEGPGKQEKLLQSGDVALDDGDRHLLTPFTGRHLGSSQN